LMGQNEAESREALLEAEVSALRTKPVVPYRSTTSSIGGALRGRS
jgi:hypothetical protein